MSEIDHKIVQTIVNHGGAVSLIELMSLVGDVPDSEIEGAVKRLEDKDLVKLTKSDEASDPLVTVRETELQRELENLEDVA